VLDVCDFKIVLAHFLRKHRFCQYFLHWPNICLKILFSPPCVTRQKFSLQGVTRNHPRSVVVLNEYLTHPSPLCSQTVALLLCGVIPISPRLTAAPPPTGTEFMARLGEHLAAFVVRQLQGPWQHLQPRALLQAAANGLVRPGLIQSSNPQLFFFLACGFLLMDFVVGSRVL